MSGFMTFAACVVVFLAVALASPRPAWIPDGQRDQNRFDVGAALVMAFIALLLAFFGGRASL